MDYEWIKFNRLIMNWSKTNAILLNHKSRNKLSNFKFGDQVINIVSDVKLLGVHFDNKLDFNIHCSNICKKVNSKT